MHIGKLTIISIPGFVLISAFLIWHFNIARIEKQTYGYLYGNELMEFCKTKGLKYFGGGFSVKGTVQTVSCCESQETRHLVPNEERSGLISSVTESVGCNIFQVN